MDGDRFRCVFCSTELVGGDVAGNGQHMVIHLAEYHRRLEKQGASELDAHRRVIALVASIKEAAVKEWR